MVGALVLLVIGVVGFPVLFETQPRPLPVDIPIELPRREAAAEAPKAAPPPKPVPAPPLPVDAGTEQARAAAASAPVIAAPPLPAEARVVQVPTSVPAPVVAPQVRPASPPETAGPASAAAGPRFVVQAGAYGEAAKLREARTRIEGLGLKTYTQVIDSDGGKRTRVRVGPYATREEAEAAAAKVKRSGLPVVVLAL